MDFELNQIFTETYSPEAAQWCNENGAYIQEIESSEDGKRQFQITAIPEPDVDEVEEQKLSELDTKFLTWYNDEATVTSSLGFVADSDARAILDVTGLVTTLEAQSEETRSTVGFMDAENQVHALTLDQLKTLQLEIVQNGQSAYAQKWEYRTQIESAESVDDLKAIEIKFTGEDFSNGGADAS